MMFTSFLVIMTGNRQYQTEKVVSQFNLSSALGKQFGVGNLFMYIYAWTSVLYMCALLAVLLDAMTRGTESRQKTG